MSAVPGTTRGLAVGLGDRQVGLRRQRVGVGGVLLAVLGSVMPGGVTVAVLVRLPVAVGSIVPVTV